MIDDFLHFINSYSWVLSMIFGSFLGNFYALWRQKRKEHNDISVPIRHNLLLQMKSLSDHQFPANILEDDDLVKICDIVSPSKASIIMNEFHSYKKLMTYDGLECQLLEGRRIKIGNTEKATASIQRLLNLIKRK